MVAYKLRFEYTPSEVVTNSMKFSTGIFPCCFRMPNPTTEPKWLEERAIGRTPIEAPSLVNTLSCVQYRTTYLQWLPVLHTQKCKPRLKLYLLHFTTCI